jgi:Primase X
MIIRWIKYFEYFADYLIQKKIKEEDSKNNNSYINNNNYIPYYEWIELLLKTPIPEFRKNVLWRILCPYLVNIKKLTNEQSTTILRDWLDKCNSESGTKLNF